MRQTLQKIPFNILKDLAATLTNRDVIMLWDRVRHGDLKYTTLGKLIRIRVREIWARFPAREAQLRAQRTQYWERWAVLHFDDPERAHVDRLCQKNVEHYAEMLEEESLYIQHDIDIELDIPTEDEAEDDEAEEAAEELDEPLAKKAKK